MTEIRFAGGMFTGGVAPTASARGNGLRDSASKWNFVKAPEFAAGSFSTAPTMRVSDRGRLDQFLVNGPTKPSAAVDGVASATFTKAAPASAAIAPADLEAAQQAAVIVGRVMELCTLFFEDYGRALEVEGLRDFFSFTQKYPSLPAPNVSAEESGALISVWKDGSRSISLKFLGNAKFHYALAYKKANRTVRPWGTITLPEFFKRFPEGSSIASAAAEIEAQ